MYQDDNARFQDFMTKYVSAISEKFPELERTRRKLLLQGIFIIIITVLIMIILYLLMDSAAIGFYILILILPGFYIYSLPKIYSKYIKNNILHKVLEECCNIRLISEEQEITENNFWSKNYSFTQIYDCFEMEYNNLKCKIFKLSVVPKDKDNLGTFEGVVIQIPNNKPLNVNIIIKPKDNYQPLFNILITFVVIANLVLLGFIFFFGNVDLKQFLEIFVPFLLIIFVVVKYKIDKKDLKRNIGSREFKYYFDIFADDLSEAKMEINDILMEKMCNFKRKFYGKSISCIYYEDKVLLAIKNSYDLFEIGNLFISINKSKTVYKFYRDINMLYEIIDYFFQ